MREAALELGSGQRLGRVVELTQTGTLEREAVELLIRTVQDMPRAAERALRQRQRQAARAALQAGAVDDAVHERRASAFPAPAGPQTAQPSASGSNPASASSRSVKAVLTSSGSLCSTPSALERVQKQAQQLRRGASLLRDRLCQLGEKRGEREIFKILPHAVEELDGARLVEHIPCALLIDGQLGVGQQLARGGQTAVFPAARRAQ